jgi:hypothetical protein
MFHFIEISGIGGKNEKLAHEFCQAGTAKQWSQKDRGMRAVDVCVETY